MENTDGGKIGLLEASISKGTDGTVQRVMMDVSHGAGLSGMIDVVCDPAPVRVKAEFGGEWRDIPIDERPFGPARPIIADAEHLCDLGRRFDGASDEVRSFATGFVRRVAKHLEARRKEQW